MQTAGLHRPVAAAVATTVTAIDMVALVALRAAPAQAWADLTATVAAGSGTTVDAIAADVACALLFVTAAWVGLALGLTALGAVPGLTGQVAERCLRMVVPAALRRVAAGAAGLGVFLTPVVANASTAAPTSPPPAPVTTMPAPTWPMSTALPSPAHPAVVPSSTARPTAVHRGTGQPGTGQPTAVHRGTGQPAATRSPTVRVATPAPRTPASTRTPTTATPAGPSPSTSPTAPTSPTTPTSPVPRRPRTGQGDDVTVRPGDCLWLIARHRLGPAGSATRTAALWPQIYRLNRDVIGDDPSVIHPGQQLRLPGRSTEERDR